MPYSFRVAARTTQALSRPGVLAMTLVVRDEEDILESNLRYHLAQGVDFVYAIDHNSKDGTPDILRGFEQMGVLRMLREDGEVHDQARRVSKLARLAHDELGADWVINNDADEFWWPALGDLKDVLCATPEPFGAVVARRYDFIPRPDGAGPFHERMVWRMTASRTPTDLPLGPKVAHRGHPRVVVAPGNHGILEPVLAQAPPVPLLEVLHFPARTFEQFVRKTIHTGRGYELLDGRGPGTGIDQLELLELHRAGGLRDYFERWTLDAAELDDAVRLGRVVHDARLRDFFACADRCAEVQTHDHDQVRDVVDATMRLAGEPGRASAEVAALVRAVSERDGIIAAHESELTALGDRATRLDTLLAGRDAELTELRRALEVVRNSRIMRSTRALRRLYYTFK